jgi:diguanylate cyclase (GGDEF)-like protein
VQGRNALFYRLERARHWSNFREMAEPPARDGQSQTAPLDKAGLPLFILSFRHRDELAVAIAAIGRRAVAARRADALEHRFIASGASIVIVDARGAAGDGLAACEALSLAASAAGAAMVVLLSRGDETLVDRFITAGVTHYLASPFDQRELAVTLALADRFVERVAGGDKMASERASLRLAESEGWMWTPGGRTVQLSANLAQRLGFAERDVHLWRLFAGIDRDGRRAAYAAIIKLLEDGLAGGFAHSVGVGERLAHHIHFDDRRGAVLGWVEASAPDKSAGRDALDGLTGLPSGEAIRAWIGNELGQRSSTDAPITLMLVGVMRFGLVNAAFGRVAGDAVLQGVARRIERILSQGHYTNVRLARTAGSEFAIAIADPVSAEAASMPAYQLCDVVSRPFASLDRLIPLTCRVGVASIEPDHIGGVSTLFQRAESALSSAKHGDAARVRMLDADGEIESERRAQLDIDLRHALHEREIDILFQPQVRIGSGKIIGVEALARWRHPRLGELGAELLFDTAERSGFVAQLSAHIQRRALELAARWPLALSHLRLAVNVTAADLATPNFVSEFLMRVDSVGFPRQRLTVEVTESGLIGDLDGASRYLSDLRHAGIRVAIDDFGTGYSSLAYLKALPLDYLKIDKALASDIAGSTRDRIVVRGVIDMARSLGLSVIAEGVETQSQLSLLAREGCSYYQGFLCSRPVDSAALITLVAGDLAECQATPAA